MDRSIQVKALTSETRMAIMKLLAEPEKHFGQQWSANPVEFGVCMTLIAEALEVAQPTVSRHLELLRQAGFITVRRHQKWAYCKRQEGVLQDYLDWLGRELAIEKPKERV
ncbi:ArsR/SmtB family transcription factor [Roseibium sp.]|uniref:ArsR/SmtB family transcription factor n=1 Tax=Roseibium sp. TaxID=1936156 RepID=UPI003D11FE93